MINFRYHVVSLTAVFLALAVGLVVGTAAANGPASDGLRSQVESLRKQKDQLRDKVADQDTELGKQEKYAEETATVMLPEKLAGKRVLLVSTPAADKEIDGLMQMLAIAGAKVSGRVELADKLMDPANNEQLLDLALTSAPPGIRGALPNGSWGVDSSAALLAAVLVGTNPVEGARSVVVAYQSQGYLSTSSEPGQADAVIMLVGGAYTETSAAKRNAAVLAVVDRFDQAGKLVLAGPVSGEGNAVGGVRSQANLAKTVSTVDNVSTAQGRVATVLAMADQYAGRVGHYGVASGATALLPHPATSREGT